MTNRDRLRRLMDKHGLDAEGLQRELRRLGVERSLNTIQGWLSEPGSKGGAPEPKNRGIPAPILRLLMIEFPTT